MDFRAAVPGKRNYVRATWLVLLLPLLSGCVNVLIPSLRQPDRLYSIDEITVRVRADDGSAWKNYVDNPGAPTRNDYITNRMYAIDVYYTKYESQLTHENQETNFLATATSLGLNTAGAITTSAAGTRLLSSLAGGVIGLDNAYNEKILISKAIQNVQTQMRANRAEQAALILGNMKCSIDVYTMGMALSDLEAYYQAGTFTAGLIKLSDTVNKAATDAKDNKDAQSPAPPVAAKAKAKIVADAQTRAAQAQTSTCQFRRPGA